MTKSPVYLNSNVFIYAIEGDAEISGLLRRLFERLRDGPGTGVTSELTLAEVLAKASGLQRRNYIDLIAWSRIFDLRPVSRDVLIEAEYRRKAGMPKLPDAIHIATAIRSECRTILSADVRLKLPIGYSVLQPNPGNLSRLVQELS